MSNGCLVDLKHTNHSRAMHCVYNIIIIIDYLLLVSVAIITINIMHREMKEELATVRGKESEVNHKKSDLEKQLEVIMMMMVMVMMMNKMRTIFAGGRSRDSGGARGVEDGFEAG